MPDMKQCPYCGEDIRAEAVRCRYCRSRLVSFDLDYWHRGHPEAKVAGVCAALAHVFGVPVVALRVAFVIFTFFTHVGPLIYGALWLVIPPRPGEDSVLEKVLRRLLDLAGTVGGRHRDVQSRDPWERDAAQKWSRPEGPPADERPFSDSTH